MGYCSSKTFTLRVQHRGYTIELNPTHYNVTNEVGKVIHCASGQMKGNLYNRFTNSDEALAHAKGAIDRTISTTLLKAKTLA
jgi:hypothetical protein